MKLYTLDYSFNKPTQQTITVGTNTDYMIGVSAIKNGQLLGLRPQDVTLTIGENVLTSEKLINGYVVFDYSQGRTPASEIVKVTILGTPFELLIIGKFSSKGDVNVDNESTEYTAGNGINIDDGEISIDETVALKDDIPTKTSDLTNDSRFLQKTEAGGISVSDIEATNITVSETAQLTGTVTIDPSNFLNVNTSLPAIPTTLSQLENDSNYATVDQIPTQVSQLDNDAGYITIDDTRDALVIEVADERQYNILHNNTVIETVSSYIRILELVQQGKAVFKYHVTDDTSKPVIYHPHICDDTAIRFDATGFLGKTSCYTRSIVLQRYGDDLITMDVSELAEIALARDVPKTTALFEGEYEDGEPFSMNVYIAD